MLRRNYPLALLFALLLLLAPPGAGRALANGAGLISAGSPLYAWVELDLIQNGRTLPSNMFPLTEREFAETVTRTVREPEEGWANRFVLVLEPLYAGFVTPYETYGGKFEKPVPADVVYLHDAIPPIVEAGTRFSAEDWMEARLVMDVTPGIMYLVGSGYYAPWKANTILPTMEFPREGYVSVALPHVNVAAGRLKTGIGHGYFGSTFLNGKAPYYDQVQASYYTPRFKFFYMIGSSQSFLTVPESEVQQNPTWDYLNKTGMVFDEPIKLFAYHRVEYHPADWVTVGLGEMNIVGGKSPDFDHINPFGIWHNTYSSECSNVMGSLDVSLVPFKGLHLYGEATMDDYRIPGVEHEGSKPNAFAYQAGLRYVLPFSDRTKYAFGLEFTHVDPWTYNRWQPYLTMYQRQIRQGNLFVDIPLGYPYGGDLDHYGAYFVAVDPDGLKMEFACHHLAKGEVEFGIGEDGLPTYEHYKTDSNPSGVFELRDTIQFAADYPLPWNLDLRAAGQYSFIRNLGHVQGRSGALGMLLIGLRWTF